MHRVFLSLIFGLFLLSPCVLQGQEMTDRQTFENTLFWTSINGTARLSKHWGMITDAHITRDDFLKNPRFYFLRLGGAYWINDQFSFVAGGAALWFATDTDVGREFTMERRIYQQALWRAQIKRVVFLQRIRIEQRWQEVLDLTDGSVDRNRFSNRFRFLFSGTIQLFENPKLPRLVISDEILFHVGEEIVNNTFDQNRLFVGFKQQLSKSWSVDYGYMMVYQQRYTGFEYDMNHTIRLFFYFSPDLRKEVDEDLPHYPVGGIE